MEPGVQWARPVYDGNNDTFMIWCGHPQCGTYIYGQLDYLYEEEAQAAASMHDGYHWVADHDV